MAHRIHVLEYLEETAARLPEKIAFADDTRTYTFGALLTSVTRVGSAAAKMASTLRSRIAVLADRTAVTVCGILGAMAAGGCYVPIDVKMPADRMHEILRQIRPSVILFSEKERKTAEALASFAPILSLEEAEEMPADNSLLREIRARQIDVDPAYMIFTSGSTGVPKGIVVSHRALIDFTECIVDFCDTTEEDVLGNQSPFYFDTSIKDVYQTLATGCTTYVLPKKLFLFPTLLMDYLNERGVTALFWSASAFRLVAESGIFEKKHLEKARLVVTGGEALQVKHLTRWQTAHPGCRFMNHYGPTEVTVDCTMYEIRRAFGEGETVPIGKACRNMEILLLTDDDRLAENGEMGEICVRGSGLAWGYFGDGEKTAAAFVQNPLNPDYPDLIYRTGDLARYNEEGELLFLSRRDEQIKHMGYRIELGEIETALSALEGVSGGICFFDEDADRIVCCCESGMDAQTLSTALKERLPRYMMPNEWRIFDRLPLNPNGKIDRVKLKEAYYNEKQ